MSRKKTNRRATGRRTFLRGTAATVVGLPLMEYMLNDHGTAYADGSALPCRFVLFFSPTSLVVSGSSLTDGFTPTRTGFRYDLGTCLQPLVDLGIEGDVSAISGLFVSPDGAPGGYNQDYHQHSQNAILTGVRHGYNGLGYHRPEGPSADQVVASVYGDLTRFPSLVYQIDPNRRGEGSSIQAVGGGGFDYVEAQTSPAQAYRSLFTGFTPAEPTPGDDLEQRLRVSSLSFAGEQIRSLQQRLGSADRQRLEAHLDQVRTLENRLATLPPAPAAAVCEELAVPNDPPDVSGGVPDHEARSALFIDLIRMALACDFTRSVTLSGTDVLTSAGMRHELWNSIGGLHADVQHSSPQRELDQANQWFVRQYAQLVARLKETPEGGGTLLDRSAAVFVMEGGKGGRAADGGGDPNHSTDNMVMLLAGRSGGLVPGQHIVARDEHTARVLNTAMRAVGVDANLGEISGVLDALFA